MELRYIGNSIEENMKDDLWEIVCAVDHDFVPALSSRESSYQKGFNMEEKSGVLPYEYFDALLKQDFILAYEDEKIVGFLSFRNHYSCEDLSPIEDSLYISTICILPEKRGLGISSALYSFTEDSVSKDLGYSYITTRTWSTNGAQMHALPKRGYEKVKVIESDRGEGIDTVYFARKVKK